jgi:hypothetical protein
MTRTRLNRLAGALPLNLSALAFAVVMGAIIAGVPPKPDEDSAAHVWQLLVASNLLMIVVFAATADWRTRRAPMILAVQLAGLAIACLPVWLAGY